MNEKQHSVRVLPQFTRYEVHKSTSPGLNPDQNSLVANITNMATTTYTVTSLAPT